MRISMPEKSANRKFRSIILRIVVIPLAILIPFNILTILLSIDSIRRAEAEMIQQDISLMNVSAQMIGTAIDFCDNEIAQFMATDPTFLQMASFDEQTNQSQILSRHFALQKWMDNLTNVNSTIDGLFIFFPDMDRLIINGAGRHYDVHRYIENQLRADTQNLKTWSIVDVGSTYLVRIRKYNNGYAGAYISISQMSSRWQLGEHNIAQNSFLFSTRQDNHQAVSTFYSINDHKIHLDLDLQKEDRLFQTQIGQTNLSLGLLVTQADILAKLPWLTKTIFVLAILAMMATPLIVMLLYNSTVKPIRILEYAMTKVGQGDLNYRIPVQRTNTENEFDRLSGQLNQMVENLDHLDKRLNKTKILHQKIQLKYISQQIRPHFILNALNLLYTYEPEDYRSARKMILFLSEYFRYIVNLQQDFVELEREFAHTKNYLEIQRARYPDRLVYSVEFETRVKDALIPPLIIQTFVENSIKYGLKTGSETYVYVLAREADDNLSLIIGDTGNGIPDETLGKIQLFLNDRAYQADLGIGIQNAVERMDIQFNVKTDIRITNQEGGGSMIEINLPLLRDTLDG